jgi:hypothetical protein
MTMEHIRSSYMSWRGYTQHKNARLTIHNMDKLYKKLYGTWPVAKK